MAAAPSGEAVVVDSSLEPDWLGAGVPVASLDAVPLAREAVAEAESSTAGAVAPSVTSKQNWAAAGRTSSVDCPRMSVLF